MVADTLKVFDFVTALLPLSPRRRLPRYRKFTTESGPVASNFESRLGENQLFQIPCLRNVLVDHLAKSAGAVKAKTGSSSLPLAVSYRELSTIQKSRAER